VSSDLVLNGFKSRLEFHADAVVKVKLKGLHAQAF